MTTEEGKAARMVQLQIDREQSKQDYYMSSIEYDELRKRSGFVLRKRTFLILLAIIVIAVVTIDQVIAEGASPTKPHCPTWERQHDVC